MSASPAAGARLLIRCEFAAGEADAREQRRAAHLAHVAANVHRIAYGGLIGADDDPVGVCYVLVADDLADGEAFVADDPYRPLYHHVTIEPLQQRFPPPQERS